MKKAFILLIISIYFGLTIVAHAELVQSDVSVSTIPEIPGPDQIVSIKLTSFAIDLSRADITWKVNGKIGLNKTGAISYQVKTDSVGTSVTVEAIISVDGSSITKSVLIVPSSIDLLWQAVDAHVPPFYKGKAMPSSQSVIKVVAMPQVKAGTIASPTSMTFAWQRNFNAYPDFSGYSKNSFLFQTSYLNAKEQISVKATDVSSGATGTQSITLTTGKPQILFYVYNPLEGILYNRELGSIFSLESSEATIVAEPYFFSPLDPVSSDLKYSWKLNGQNISTPSKKNWLVIKKPEGIAGSASIAVSIASISRLFQSAEKSVIVNLE